MHKLCYTCKLDQPLDDFPRNRTRPDGRAGICKACQRLYVKSHYWRNRDAYLEKARRRNARIQAELRVAIRRLKDVPCADCGKRYPYWVMQFDHVNGDKEFNIGGGIRMFPGRILAEAAKCEVVCANCHANRTFQRLARARSSVE